MSSSCTRTNSQTSNHILHTHWHIFTLHVVRPEAAVVEDVSQIIQAAIAEHDTTGDDDEEEEEQVQEPVVHRITVQKPSFEAGGGSDEEEYGADEDGDSEDFEQLDLETDKSGKVKTIKKHSKVNIKINKQLAQRPTVEDIEWEVTPASAVGAADQEVEVVTKEISSVNLEDVSNDRRYSLDKMEPTSPASLRVDRMFEKSFSTPGEDQQKAEQIVIISSDNNISEVAADYSGDIDEFIFVQTSPENYAKMEKEQNTTDEDDNSNLVIITEEHYDYELETDDDDRRSSVIDQSSPQDDEDSSPQKFIIGGTSSSESDEDRLIGSEEQHRRRDLALNPTSTTPSILITQPGTEASCSVRTGGSSSGSDVALHETGGELSDDDETGKVNNFGQQPVAAVDQCATSDVQQPVEESTAKNQTAEETTVSVPTPTASEADFIMLENNLVNEEVVLKPELGMINDREEVVKLLELNGDESSPRKLPVECEDLLDLLEDEQEPDNLNDQADQEEDSTSVRMTEDEESTTSLPVANVTTISTATTSTTTTIGDGTTTAIEQTVVVNENDKNYLVQNTDHGVVMVEPSEPPKGETSSRTDTNTIVNESEDGSVRTTVITTTTTINASSSDGEIPPELQQQLLEQLQNAANQSSNATCITTVTTAAEGTGEPQDGQTTTTTTTTTTKTITLTSTDADFPEDELLSKITTTTQQMPGSDHTRTTVTVTEVVEGKPDAKPSINSIVDGFMNEERKN